MATTIEALFLLLSDSALAFWDDPISFDKLVDLIVGPVNNILGHMVDIWHLTVSTPLDYHAKVCKMLQKGGIVASVLMHKMRSCLANWATSVICTLAQVPHASSPHISGIHTAHEQISIGVLQ